MTIIIPEFWLWVAVAAMAISCVLSIIQIRLTRQHTQILRERQRQMHRQNMAALEKADEAK